MKPCKYLCKVCPKQQAIPFISPFLTLYYFTIHQVKYCYQLIFSQSSSVQISNMCMLATTVLCLTNVSLVLLFSASFTQEGMEGFKYYSAIHSHDGYVFACIMYVVIYIYKQIPCVDFISAFLFEGQLHEIFSYFQQCCYVIQLKHHVTCEGCIYSTMQRDVFHMYDTLN